MVSELVGLMIVLRMVCLIFLMLNYLEWYLSVNNLWLCRLLIKLSSVACVNVNTVYCLIYLQSAKSNNKSRQLTLLNLLVCCRYNWWPGYCPINALHDEVSPLAPRIDYYIRTLRLFSFLWTIKWSTNISQPNLP